MTMLYDDFAFEAFEAGRGLWHARIRRVDLAPVVINGVPFSSFEVGFAWSDRQMAVADASKHDTKRHIDRNRALWN